MSPSWRTSSTITLWGLPRVNTALIASICHQIYNFLHHSAEFFPVVMVTMNVQDLKVKIFADGAEKAAMLELTKNPLIKGFTTNPTLMRKAGVADYAAFAKDVLSSITDKPISFEVFSDDFKEMERQAGIIASWGENVYVKIPITNTKGESSIPLIERLSARQVKLNITAILTREQVREAVTALERSVPSVISVFAGRIADTGRDPVPTMVESRKILREYPKAELLWASTREVLNIMQAEEAGCHIITVPNDILKKLSKWGYDLTALSLDTVKMFYEDGKQAGYSL
ncbi:MAG: transaldolase [Parcubacteria group bacterium Greene0416_79]|nr:MAG: transaldolase [Parcubacteria group bacterium Greene0416_79]